MLQIQSENNKREMLKLMVDITSLFSLYLAYALYVITYSNNKKRIT